MALPAYVQDELRRLQIERIYTHAELRKRSNVYAQQADFLNSHARHLAFISGIGGGKTWAGSLRALKAAYGIVGNNRIRTPNLGVITGPTYPQLRDSTLRTFLEIADGLIDRFNRSEMVIRMKNGSEVLLRNASDPDALRGPSIAWWFGDEAALYDPMVRRIMLGRLRQFGQRGYEWITTTPRGRNWVWQVYVRDRLDTPDYHVVRATSRDNTFLDPEIVAEWEREYTGDFARQELLAEFVAFEGLIYADFSRDVHVTGEIPGVRNRIIAGVDWGYANPGGILVGSVNGDDELDIVTEEYAKQRRVEEWVNVAVQLRDTWNVSIFYCDPSEPEYIAQFRKAGLNAVKGDNTVLPGIQRVQNRLVRQPNGRTRLRINRGCPNLINEAEQYHWMDNKYGMRDAPVKANDHLLDCLRMMVNALDGTKYTALTAKGVRYA